MMVTVKERIESNKQTRGGKRALSHLVTFRHAHVFFLINIYEKLS